MATDSMQGVFRHLRRAALLREDGLTDGQLLECFLTRRDEAAFEALVRRHGPMVLGVCRRVLGNPHDAEDAFQATFLVLARKAASVRPQEAVGNWLYGVAYRTALKARALTARQSARERELREVPRPEAPGDGPWQELLPLLDRELSRLPDKYRVPVVLCDLEGKGRAEAARQLGWPEGTLSGRLARARALLAKRLARYSTALSAGAVATLCEAAPSSGVPTRLVVAAVQAVTGPGETTGVVAALARGVVRAMFLTKLKLATAVLLGACAAACALTQFAYHALAAGQAEATPDAAVAPAGRVTAEPQAGQEKPAASVREMPPVVVRTVPQAGDTQVDAKTVTEIRVTFSKDMLDESWSWSQISDQTFPKATGRPRYDKGRRTCVLPVKLEPGKPYVLWLNSEKFGNFKDAEGKSAVPYLLVFETKP